MSIEEKNKQIVAEFLEALSAGDIEAILSRFTDDGTWWNNGTIEGLSGPKSISDFVEMFGAVTGLTTGGAIPMTALAWTAEGDRVAVETTTTTELKDGRVYRNDYHMLFVLRDGKVHAVKEYMDTEHARATFVTGR
jgi:ketosteroid isomerase-like protein